MSRLRLGLGIAISLALVVYLLARLDLRQLAAQLGRTEWQWAVLGGLLGLLGLWARARRWSYLFPPRSSPPALVPAMAIGYMANNVLPLRAGEIVRVYVVARRWGHGFWTVLATLVVERVLDSLALVLILAVLVLIIPVPAFLQWAAAVLLAIDLIGVALLAALALRPAACWAILARLVRRIPRLQAPAHRVFQTFGRGLEGIRTPRHVLPLAAWTVVVWLFPALAAWATLHAMGFALPASAPWTVMAFVGLGISIPSAPGYVGVFHAAAALAVGLFGVPDAPAIGFALVYHASQYVPVTLAGWLFLVREHVSLAEASHATAGASSD